MIDNVERKKALDLALSQIEKQFGKEIGRASCRERV